MGADRQERIRQRAYEMWEKDGKPYGEDLKHWLQASEEVGEGNIGEMSLSGDLSYRGSSDAVTANSGRTAAKTTKSRGATAKAGQSKPKAMPKANSVAEKTKSTPTMKITTGKESPKKQVKRVEGP